MIYDSVDVSDSKHFITTAAEILYCPNLYCLNAPPNALTE